MGNSSPNILKLLDHHPRNAVHLIGIPSTSLIIHYLHYWLQCAPPTECTSVIHLGYFNNISCHGHFLQERPRWLSHHYPSNILSYTPSKFGNKPQFLFLPLEHLIPQYHGCNLTRKNWTDSRSSFPSLSHEHWEWSPNAVLVLMSTPRKVNKEQI